MTSPQYSEFDAYNRYSVTASPAGFILMNCTDCGARVSVVTGVYLSYMMRAARTHDQLCQGDPLLGAATKVS